MPLRMWRERLKMRGVAANTGDEFHAAATKASSREYLATSPTNDCRSTWMARCQTKEVYVWLSN
jgi:hypothetical protein